MNITFLGSGDAFGSGGRLQTCLLVEAQDYQLLVDCGASSLIGLERFAVYPNAIAAIVVSHLHGDHFAGIPFFIVDAQVARKRESPLTVVGPVGIQGRVAEAMETLFPGSWSQDRRFAIEFIEFQARREVHVGPVTVTPYEVVHPSGAPAYALRVASSSKVFAYSGDTEWTEELIEAARGTDLFICESYTYEKKVRYHLDYRTLMHNADRLRSQRLVVTHMSRDMLGRVDTLEHECAEDGKRIEL
jgi:ribonuclease BN (tRNA processing enzyme)